MALRTPRRFTIQDYEAMFAAGILTELDGVELVQGEIVEKPLVSPPIE